MHKPIEFCTNCNANQEMDLSLSLMTLNNPDGIEEFLLYHYHCSSCNSYVRTTTLDHEEYIRPEEFVMLSIPVYI
jgi:hypothetical protein